MSAIAWLPEVLRSAGVAVVEHDGWLSRSRSGRFSPRGVLVHHTGAGEDSALVDLCIRGRADLPGPLCHVVLTRDGAWHLIAGGLANHAGNGALPWDASGATTGGNAQLIGIEITNAGDGVDPYPDPQVDALVTGVRAILDHTGWSHSHVTTHAAFARPAGRKLDPRGPAWLSPGPGTWTPTDLRQAIAGAQPPTGDDVATPEEIAEAVWGRQMTGVAGQTTSVAEFIKWTEHHARTVASARAVVVDVDQLAAALAQRLPGLDAAALKAAVVEALTERPLRPA